MRIGFSWRIILVVLIALILIIFLGVSCASDINSNLGAAYPPPDVGLTLETHSEAAHWLILGAAVIVVIIFGSVALRRNKS